MMCLILCERARVSVCTRVRVSVCLRVCVSVCLRVCVYSVDEFSKKYYVATHDWGHYCHSLRGISRSIPRLLCPFLSAQSNLAVVEVATAAAAAAVLVVSSRLLQQLLHQV